MAQPPKKKPLPPKYLDNKKEDGKKKPPAHHGASHKPPPHKAAAHGPVINPQAAKAMALIQALHSIGGPVQGMPPQGMGIPQGGGPAPVPPMQPNMKPTP